MKHKYLYIEASAELDESAKAYFVMIGTGKQDQRDYLYLIQYSVQHGHYFEKYSSEVAEFLHKITESIPQFPPVVQTDARSFVRSLKAGARPTLTQDQLLNRDHVLTYLNLNYRLSRFAKSE